MTTTQIETLANAGNIANADFDLKLNLRRLVVPEFLLKLENVIGQVEWLRSASTLSYADGDRNKDLPTNFRKMLTVRRLQADGTLSDPLEYIGDDPDKVLESEANTVRATPARYWIVAGSPARYAVRLDAPSNGIYTLHYSYWKTIPWTDNTTEVDLDSHIPWEFQAGLVKALRREIAKDRWGAGDRRYQIEATEFEDWINALWRQRSHGPQSKAVFVR